MEIIQMRYSLFLPLSSPAHFQNRKSICELTVLTKIIKCLTAANAEQDDLNLREHLPRWVALTPCHCHRPKLCGFRLDRVFRRSDPYPCREGLCEFYNETQTTQRARHEAAGGSPWHKWASLSAALINPVSFKFKEEDFQNIQHFLNLAKSHPMEKNAKKLVPYPYQIFHSCPLLHLIRSNPKALKQCAAFATTVALWTCTHTSWAWVVPNSGWSRS